ncbi:MAG TPA: hypothetical protein VMD78_00175 [Candidatus Baltobacteraceae bacterium]|nr:hypothetical protein [Candidatus Baltobacteraceae bacterium]
MMTNVDRRISSATSTSSPAVTLGAFVLISLGVAFQLCELGYAHLSKDSHWFASLILESLWSLLDGWVKAAALGDGLRFWPLAFVLAGCAVLMSRRRA